MDIENRRAMEHYLPMYTRVVKTPDIEVCYWDNTAPVPKISIDVIELKTHDIISAFLDLQQTALHNAHKEVVESRRKEAIARIKEMNYFKDPMVYERSKAKFYRGR